MLKYFRLFTIMIHDCPFICAQNNVCRVLRKLHSFIIMLPVIKNISVITWIASSYWLIQNHDIIFYLVVIWYDLEQHSSSIALHTLFSVSTRHKDKLICHIQVHTKFWKMSLMCIFHSFERSLAIAMLHLPSLFLLPSPS